MNHHPVVPVRLNLAEKLCRTPRYRGLSYFMDDPDRLFQLIRLGARGPVTGGSLLGQFGGKSENVGFEMIERHLVHVVASDAHDSSYRRPVLSESAEAVTKRFGAERVSQMFEEYPAALVSGLEIDPPSPVEAPKRFRGFLSRFFSGERY